MTRSWAYNSPPRTLGTHAKGSRGACSCLGSSRPRSLSPEVLSAAAFWRARGRAGTSD